MKRTFFQLVVLGLLLPAVAWCQPPIPLAIWIVPHPYGIAFDAAGNAYVAQYQGNHIVEFAPDGTRLSQWGSYGSDASSLTGPWGVAMDALDHLYVVELTVNNPTVQTGVQEFTSGGTYIASLGSHSNDGFTQPQGVAIGADGRIYVTDTGSPRTSVFASDGTFLFAWPSQGNTIALDGHGHAFEVEEGGVVREYTTSGVELTHWGGPGSDPGQFASPIGIAVDAAGRVYVTDTYNHRVQVFTSDGAFLMQWGGLGSDPGLFYRPSGIAVGRDNRIYVSDTWNSRIQVFGPVPTAAKPTSWGLLKALYR